MANATGLYGLAPDYQAGAGAYTGRLMRVKILSDYGTALYIGDPVIWVGTGDVTGRCPIVQKFTQGATNKILGVIQAFSALPTDLSKNYNPANTARYAYIILSTDCYFKVRDDGSAVLGIDSIGLNANLSTSTGGSTSTGFSGVSLNASSTGSDATYQVTIIGAADTEDNDPTLANAEWIVAINLPSLFPGVAGVA